MNSDLATIASNALRDWYGAFLQLGAGLIVFLPLLNLEDASGLWAMLETGSGWGAAQYLNLIVLLSIAMLIGNALSRGGLLFVLQLCPSSLKAELLKLPLSLEQRVSPLLSKRFTGAILSLETGAAVALAGTMGLGVAVLSPSEGARETWAICFFLLFFGLIAAAVAIVEMSGIVKLLKSDERA